MKPCCRDQWRHVNPWWPHLSTRRNQPAASKLTGCSSIPVPHPYPAHISSFVHVSPDVIGPRNYVPTSDFISFYVYLLLSQVLCHGMSKASLYTLEHPHQRSRRFHFHCHRHHAQGSFLSFWLKISQLLMTFRKANWRTVRQWIVPWIRGSRALVHSLL